MQALVNVNTGHRGAYGSDERTERTRQVFAEHFGPCDVYFVCGGTAANVLGLQLLAPQEYNAVICSDVAHIHSLECGGPRRSLLFCPSVHGKLTPQSLEPHLEHMGDKHHVQPTVVSIAQTTEFHTVYTPEEIRELADFAHTHDMYLQMDGARLCNAAAALGCSLKEITADCGVDVLAFGGTKNGMLFGDAVVFFREGLADDFLFRQKHCLQLIPKLWGISVQFEALLSNNVWQENAERANGEAAYLGSRIAELPDFTITQPVETNAVFADLTVTSETLRRQMIAKIKERYPFMIYEGQMRFVTSFDTKREELDVFVEFLRALQ